MQDLETEYPFLVNFTCQAHGLEISCAWQMHLTGRGYSVYKSGMAFSLRPTANLAEPTKLRSEQSFGQPGGKGGLPYRITKLTGSCMKLLGEIHLANYTQETVILLLPLGRKHTVVGMHL